MKIVTIIGARPQIIKAAAISRAISENFADKLHEIIVHTGQHYDENMSNVFFEELNIPKPDYNLAVGSGNHGAQTAKMLSGIEAIILEEQPDAVLVYGDTNSTVAGGLAASKLQVPLVHIEAGLRSFNKTMPEEINRIACDHMSTLLFAPTKTGIENLKKEGFEINNKPPFSIDNPKVYHCGDVMFDNSLHFSALSETKSRIIDNLKLNQAFILSTIHRDNNTDDPKRLTAIFEALIQIADSGNIPIVLPLHPRTKKMMEVNLSSDFYSEIKSHPLIKLIPPVSFLDVIALEKHAKMIITDSGGLQKEAFFFETPCLILRSETEWKEIVDNGNAIICDADKSKIIEGYQTLSAASNLSFPAFYGDGKAAQFICQEVISQLG
ncbi:MAG: UDP-N-acetylglucosamine 2-epimerase (non-hydrolyzing) [Crocinitomicaceae bacterium]